MSDYIHIFAHINIGKLMKEGKINIEKDGIYLK